MEKTAVLSTNLKEIMAFIRNKFTTSELVLANSDKTIGAHLNHTAQDGLISISPISETEGTAALWLTDAQADNKTELTGGTFAYVVGEDANEKGAYLSLVGNTVTFGKIGETDTKILINNIAEPETNYQVANKLYVDRYTINKAPTVQTSTINEITMTPGEMTVLASPGFNSGVLYKDITSTVSVKAYFDDKSIDVGLMVAINYSLTNQAQLTVIGIYNGYSSKVIPKNTLINLDVYYRE